MTFATHSRQLLCVFVVGLHPITKMVNSHHTQPRDIKYDQSRSLCRASVPVRLGGRGRRLLNLLHLGWPEILHVPKPKPCGQPQLCGQRSARRDAVCPVHDERLGCALLQPWRWCREDVGRWHSPIGCVQMQKPLPTERYSHL